MDINFQDSPKPIIKPYSFTQRVNPRSFDIEMFIKQTGAKISLMTPFVKPHYDWVKDEIQIPGISFFNSAALYYKTLFHELGHWTGSRNRLRRSIAGHPNCYAKEEVIAECTAFFLAGYFGFADVIHDYAANYIREWGEASWMFECMNKADKATKYLVSL